MFISRAEKEQFQNLLELIQKQIASVKNDILNQQDLISSHRNVISTLITQLEATKNSTKPKRTMSPEGRAKMSRIMKERHAKNKLEKQNATSVSTTSI
jgi:hypothetical protein